MKSKLLIMLKQSVFRNLSPNDFEDLLEGFEQPGITSFMVKNKQTNKQIRSNVKLFM